MKIVTLLQAKSRLAGVEAELLAANEKLAAFSDEAIQARIDAAVSSVSVELTAQLEVLTASVSERDASVLSLKAELDAAKSVKIDADKDAATKAAAIVANVTGIPALAVTEGEASPGSESESIVDQYMRLQATDKLAAGRFWNSNLAALRKIGS